MENEHRGVTVLQQAGIEMRRYDRVKASSVLVSLKPTSGEEITGFLRDISEGGLKIQKLSTQRQVENGRYFCEFYLPSAGKISAPVEVVGYGTGNEKFGDHLIRMRFLDLPGDDKAKIKQFIFTNAEHPA